MTIDTENMRGDEMLLTIEINGAVALRKALRDHATHTKMFANSPTQETLLRQICKRATNQDDAA
jgi:guanylate kinase